MVPMPKGTQSSARAVASRTPTAGPAAAAAREFVVFILMGTLWIPLANCYIATILQNGHSLPENGI